MAKVKFDFDKPYDEFEINGKTFKVYFDDESLETYESQARKFYEDSNKVKDPLSLPAKEKKKVEEKQKKMIKETIETFFGEGSYDYIYEASGKSILNLTEIVMAVFDWLNDKIQTQQKKAAEYYTK